MSRNAVEGMKPRLSRFESVRATPASTSSVSHEHREMTDTGGRYSQQAQSSSTSHSTFKTEALRQAESRAKAHLRKRRLHDASVTLAGESEPLKGKGRYLYFLSDGDVKDIVGIVMDAVRQSLITPARHQVPRGSEANANFDDSTTSAQGFAYERRTSGFSYGKHSITPRLSTAADPATTISVPKTVFSSTNWDDRRVSFADSGLSSSTKTTIVSRGSVSEIIWTEHRSSDAARFRHSLSSAGHSHDAVCQHCLRCHSLSQCHNMMEVERAASVCRFASLFPLSTNLAASKRAYRSTDEESNITSFPELRPRNCTNDWLKPPIEIDQLLRNKSSDFYRRGIDAHSGLMPKSPQSSTRPSPVPFSLPCDESVFNSKDSFFGARRYLQDGRVTETLAGDGRKQSFKSMSSTSYSRRATPVPAANQSPWQSDGELISQIVNTLRQHSQDGVRGESVDSGECDDWPQEPETLQPPEARPAAVHRSRDSIVKERTLKPPVPDKAGIYEALTGSRMVVPKRGCTNCSEDNRPHLCKDDVESRTSLG
ncbi:hypothetical protein E4U60_003872 [Claviceps pazoutovae]|uniref:Uncharacterized protein n=1 Tax=Claviceps pazoutovae TaxID=1649127 RepID=A0A9P7SJD2_9HYPO|nr:hypothetical protein E4U60_003872 [Claviceps pazoutovae]